MSGVSWRRACLTAGLVVLSIIVSIHAPNVPSVSASSLPASSVQGPSIDGSVINGCSHYTNSCSTLFSTSQSDDIILVFTTEALDLQTSCIFSVSDTAGLSWTMRASVSGHNDGATSGNRDQLAEFWARSVNTISADNVTESISGCASAQYGGEYNGLMILGIAGANFNNPFDPNSNLPGTAAGNSWSPSAMISTSNANDMVIGVAYQSSNAVASPGPGFTFINTGGASPLAEYQISQAPLSNFSVSFSDTTSWYWEVVGDAIRPGSSTSGFAIWANPTAMLVLPSGSVQSTISLASLNNFQGTVSLSVTTPVTGFSTVIQPSSQFLSANKTVQSILTITSHANVTTMFNVLVNATNGSISHSVLVQVSEKQFLSLDSHFPFRDSFNYSSIDSMVQVGWAKCGQGSNQSYAVSSGSLTLQNGAAMCWNNIPSGIPNWTVVFKGSWAYNQYPTSGVEMVVQTTSHVYKFAAGEGNGLVMYRDGTVITNNYGWYSYCAVDGRSCYYTDYGVTHTWTLVMQGGVLTASFQSPANGSGGTVAVGAYTEPDPGTNLVSASPMAGSDIGVIWNYVRAYDPTTTKVSCAPNTIPVDQATTCTAIVGETLANATTPTGAVVFTTSATCTTNGITWTCPSPIGSCTLNSQSGASASCSVTYTPCSCYADQASPGTHTITATYSDDSIHGGSSGTFSLNETPLKTTATSITCNANSIVINQVATCTVTVTDTSSTPTTPTGSAQLVSGNYMVIWPANIKCTLKTINANSASCSLDAPAATPGETNIGPTGTYDGDSSHYRSDSTGLGIVVNKRATSSVLNCSPNPVAINMTSSCTVTVTDTDIATAITPTGTIAFSSNSTGTFDKGICTLAGTGTLGQASCSIAYTPRVTGHHGITGVYEYFDGSQGIWIAGDATHNGSSGSTALALSNDPTVAINSTVNFQGVTIVTSGSLTIGSATIYGTVSVTASNSSTGAVVFSKTYNISNLVVTSNEAKFLLNLSVSPYPLSADVTISLKGGVWSVNVMVTRQLDIAQQGSVNVQDLSEIALVFHSSMGSPLYNPLADITGAGTINIQDLAILAFFFDAPVYS